MKLTLVLVEIRSGFPGFSGHYAEGVASIAAATRRAGHEVDLVHVTRPVAPGKLAAAVARTNPDLVGFSCVTHTFSYTRSFVSAVKALLPNRPVILGGVHAILNPEECIAVDGIDAVCLGEGEDVVVGILGRLRDGAGFQDLEGLWVRDGTIVHRNPVLPWIADLDSLAPPDRGVFDFPRLVSSLEGTIYVFASRGCPYSCHFCCNAAIRASCPSSSGYLRFKSVERVCEEIDAALRLFPGRPRGIFFQDDILPINRAWFADFAREYARRVSIPFNCNLRADLVSPEVIECLETAGCVGVSVGLESGVERIRMDTLGKPIADHVYREAFGLLRAAGIRVASFSMVGLPNETVEDALATVRMNAELGVDRALVSVFCPYPGTKLHDRCVSDGTLSGRMPDTFQDWSPLDQKSITQDQVRFIHDYFGLLVSLARKRPDGWGWRAATSILKRGGPALRLPVSGKRLIKRALTIPYLYLGRHLINRHERVFRPS